MTCKVVVVKGRDPNPHCSQAELPSYRLEEYKVHLGIGKHLEALDEVPQGTLFS